VRPGGGHLGAGGGLGGVGDHPGGVVVGGLVGVVGVQVEAHPGVAEVVLLPPAHPHGVHHLPGAQVGAGGQDVDLTGAALLGLAAGDLPHPERPRPGGVGQGQVDEGVGEVPGVHRTVWVDVRDLGERFLGQVRGGAFAPGHHVEAGLVQVLEQGRGPPAAVERHEDTPVIADRGPQRRDQAAQLTRQRGARLGHHDQDRVAVGVGDPRLHRGRGREPGPREVGLGDLAGAVVGAHVPVDVEQERGVRVLGVLPGQQVGRHRLEQVGALARRREVGELAADGLDLRGAVHPEEAAQVERVDPGGALRPRFPDQGASDPVQQDGVQPVEPARQRPEHRVRARQQASRR